MKLGFCVMAHPDRADMACLLARHLPPSTTFIWDTDNTVWNTGKRAWLEGVGSETTHWVVIQDDAVLSLNLEAALQKALPYVNPQSPVSLYLGNTRPYKVHVDALVAKAKSFPTPISWITMNRTNWGVGLVVPTVQIPHMIEYCEGRGVVSRRTPYDGLLSKWFEFNKIPVYYTWPSLVDHRRGPSILHSEINRRAHWFIGEEKSGVDVDWSGRIVSVPQYSRQKP